MIIIPRMVRAAWATAPSGPGRRTSSTAPNAALQKSMAAAGSRHTSIGITTGTPSGTGFTPLIVGILPNRPVGRDGLGIGELALPRVKEQPLQHSQPGRRPHGGADDALFDDLEHELRL